MFFLLSLSPSLSSFLSISLPSSFSHFSCLLSSFFLTLLTSFSLYFPLFFTFSFSLPLFLPPYILLSLSFPTSFFLSFPSSSLFQNLTFFSLILAPRKEINFSRFFSLSCRDFEKNIKKKNEKLKSYTVKKEE